LRPPSYLFFTWHKKRKSFSREVIRTTPHAGRFKPSPYQVAGPRGADDQLGHVAHSSNDRDLSLLVIE